MKLLFPPSSLLDLSDARLCILGCGIRVGIVRSSDLTHFVEVLILELFASVISLLGLFVLPRLLPCILLIGANFDV